MRLIFFLNNVGILLILMDILVLILASLKNLRLSLLKITKEAVLFLVERTSNDY